MACDNGAECAPSSWGHAQGDDITSDEGISSSNPEYDIGEGQMDPNTKWLETHGYIVVNGQNGGCKESVSSPEDTAASCGAGCRAGCAFCDSVCGESCKGSCGGGCSSGCSGGCSGCSGSCRNSCTGCSGSCRGGCEGTCNTLCNIGCKGGAMDELNLKLNRIIEADNIREIFELIIYEAEVRLKKEAVKDKNLLNEISAWTPENEEKLFLLYYNIPRLFENTFLNYLGVTLKNNQSGTLIFNETLQEYVPAYLGSSKFNDE